MLKRQGMRAAFGMIAAVFAVGVLVLCNVAGWQVLRWYVQPIYATLVLLGINMVVMAVFAALAARSSPGYAEREALRIRQQAIQEARGSSRLDRAGAFGRNRPPFAARDEFAPAAVVATAYRIATMGRRGQNNAAEACWHTLGRSNG